MENSPSSSALTPFIRYRHGIELRIAPNVKESIKIFIETYKQQGEAAFRSLITDISDGSGPGTSRESTWYKAIEELFESSRDYEPNEQSQVKLKYVEFLEILSSDGSSEEIWERLKSFFEKDMDLLSLWEFSHHKQILEQTNPFRDADGKVYEQSGSDVVEVVNGNTLAETMYGFITDDICSKYGSVGLLLRLTRIVFIANSISANPQDYSPIYFVMSDDGYNTWFLQGYWRLKAANQERFIKWHPKDYFTDISWLESEFVSVVAKVVDSQIKESTDPSAPPAEEKSDTTMYKKSVEGYSLQYELALDTNVFISNEKDELPDEIYVDFESRLIRWINGSTYRCPVLIIPTNDQNYFDAMEISRKFISMLIFENPHISIREGGSVGHPVRYYPAMIHQPRLPSINTISSGWINTSSQGNNQNKWLVLSYYKEAQNSDSVFYKFLNYYKIIQRAFLNSDGSENKDLCRQWIGGELQARAGEQTVQQIISDAQSLHMATGLYIEHIFRDAAAHVGVLNRRVTTGIPTISPDNQADKLKYYRAVEIVESLARKTIENSTHV